MSVSIENPRAESIGNGVTTTFPHSFTVLEADDLVVEVESSGIISPMTLGVDYTVTGIGSASGSVTFTTAPGAGVLVRRYRSTTLDRSQSYQENGDLPAATVNADFDRIWLALQEFQTGAKEIGNTLRVQVGESVQAIPETASRASKLLGFNAAGQPVAVTPSDQSAAALSLALASSTGADMIGWAGGLSLLDRINAYSVLATDFGVDMSGGVESSAALNAALNSGAKIVVLPPGVVRISSGVVIPAYVTLIGAGFGLFTGTGATRILKTGGGTFQGITVNGASQLLNLSVESEGATGGDGVYIVGGRSNVDKVSAFGHGRDGFRLGALAGEGASANTNIWRIGSIIARSNTRHGVYISHDDKPTLPDVNAGLALSIEATSNGGDGVRIGAAIDNALHGIVSQGNTGHGIRCIANAKGNRFGYPYIEANTAGEVQFDSGADRNFYEFWRSGSINDGVTDNGANNLVIGRHGSISNVPLHRSAEAFRDLQILETTTSGVWRLTKEATTRHAVLELANTSASADLLITNTSGGAAGIRLGSGTYDAAMRAQLKGGGALNFGSIPAQSTVDVAVTLTGADASYEYTATPTHAIPAGVTWAAYWDGSAVKVRCANTTTTAKTVNGSFSVIARKMV